MDLDRYAVIGQPIAHSKSPFIHASFARALGHKLSYEAIEVAPDALAATLGSLHAEGFLGLSVTLPHKVAAKALCETVSERAEQAGAVNCLIRTASGWRGDNVDGLGLAHDLSANLGISLAHKRVLLLGAGGAARGVIAPLLALKPEQLVVSNRNPWKPEELAERFKALGPIVPRTHLSLKGDLYDVVINATSAGHGGEMIRLPAPLLAKGGVAYDLSYGHAAEPFLRWARASGAGLVSDGLGMLVEQAAESYRLWRGVRPETASVLACLREPEHLAAKGARGPHHVERVNQD